MIPKEVKPTQKEKTNPDQQPLSFSSLPNEIAENCLARISKWNYPSLSLVSKRFLSFLSSHELYMTRSHIKTTEPCLYLCVMFPKQQSPTWFTLWMKPGADDEDEDEIQEDYSLVHVPSSSLHPPYCSTVAVCSDIYLIGAPYKSLPSSVVHILDCRNQRWRDGPKMMVDRECPFRVNMDEKIYLMGRCEIGESWMEVLDVKTQTWKVLPSHGAEELNNDMKEGTCPGINVLEGKIYAIADKKDYAYDPENGTWEVVETHKSTIWIDAWCVIENVMYCYTNSGYFLWYDSKSREWRDVKGSDLEALRTSHTFSLAPGCVVEIFNYGGKLLVIWVPRFEEYNAKRKRRIWCAKIVLEKRDNGDIWGKMEWVNTVLTVSKSYTFLSCVVISI